LDSISLHGDLLAINNIYLESFLLNSNSTVQPDISDRDRLLCIESLKFVVSAKFPLRFTSDSNSKISVSLQSFFNSLSLSLNPLAECKFVDYFALAVIFGSILDSLSRLKVGDLPAVYQDQDIQEDKVNPLVDILSCLKPHDILLSAECSLDKFHALMSDPLGSGALLAIQKINIVSNSSISGESISLNVLGNGSSILLRVYNEISSYSSSMDTFEDSIAQIPILSFFKQPNEAPQLHVEHLDTIFDFRRMYIILSASLHLVKLGKLLRVSTSSSQPKPKPSLPLVYIKFNKVSTAIEFPGLTKLSGFTSVINIAMQGSVVTASTPELELSTMINSVDWYRVVHIHELELSFENIEPSLHLGIKAKE
jgi:hypothetical protein